MNAQDKQHLDKLIHSARIVVREIGSAAKLAEGAGLALRYGRYDDSLRTCIMHAYDMACAHLTQLDPAGAPQFIRVTYGPSFRQTEVSRG